MALMSKRAQARTEKELHDLLRVPGNTTCADCGARNPSWASWNLGVFLCMRCASLHRKLGTHISKVKSLSMDTWSPDQVETMKKNGNLAVNKVYNPKNKRPDMPLDADEVDSAMERFIRKKYQEKSLSDGKPEVPSRDNIPPARSKSPDISPPPALPSKKGRFFGFGLRASSSAYPLSKHDKKHRNEPRVDSTFRISSEDYTTGGSSRAEISDHDLQVKLAQLRDMGFGDNERNINILKRHNGDLETAISTLVKLGPSEQPSTRRTVPAPTITTNVDFPAPTSAPKSVSAPQSATSSLNPFGQIAQASNLGLSYGNTAPTASVSSTNPWQASSSQQNTTGVEQSFANLQVSQPLFPNTTGGYPGPSQHPPQPSPQASSFTQQYPTASSPVSMNNPFMPAPMSAHSTGSNPYAAHMQSLPGFAPSTNPFLHTQLNAAAQQASFPEQSFNPFGLPPSSSPPQAQSPPISSQPQPNIFDARPTYQNGSQGSMYGATQLPTQQQFTQFNAPQSPPALPNFQYGQPQIQPIQQQQQQQQTFLNQQPQNPFFQQQQQPQSPPFQQQPQQQPQSQYLYQHQQQLPVQQQSQPMMPQQTGLMDKRSILALYSYPQLAPSKPLASIPEPADEYTQIQNQQQQQHGQFQQQTVSPAPSAAVYGGTNNSNPAKRSATMPASSMHSAGGTGSRNPFLSSTNSSTSSIPSIHAQQYGGYPQGALHASRESMVVNNPNLQDGRHSPDAFAGLSARY